jgi:hypothetical protein
MDIKLILISKEENAQAVSDRLVKYEDQINASVGAIGPTSLNQLNLVLSSISDQAAENSQFAENFAGPRRLAGLNTFGIVVPYAETEFAETPADEVVANFLRSADQELSVAALPHDFPRALISEALRSSVS